MGDEMNARTVGGLMAYCDWLKAKGYQGGSATESWKSAAKVVFETVEPDSWESVDLSELDVDEYIKRFQTLAGSKYRAETVTVYGRRIKNAIEAHSYYLENGKPPSFKRSSARKSDGEPPKTTASKPGPTKSSTSPPVSVTEMWDLDYPLSSGMVHMRLPKRMTKSDVDRLSTVLRTLQVEEQRQIPANSGSAEEALAA
jgi:hypothetical protein